MIFATGLSVHLPFLLHPNALNYCRSSCSRILVCLAEDRGLAVQIT